MEVAAALADEEGFVKADLEFHFAVAKAGHNHLLEQFYHLVRELLSEVIAEMVALPKVKDESIVLQRAIALAIEEKNIQRAEEAAQKHMQYIENLLRIYS
jgi:GntR family transcriptional repressor for pyruvate dehydrogenase complex